MTDIVTTEITGPIGLIALDNPPVNAAGAALRQGLWAAIENLEADPGVKAIGLYAKGRTFIAGADIREFGKPPVDPLLPDLCTRVEACTKPVVAVLHGNALGGGLEVAISAHARIALPGLTVGFPEVTLGIIPGAGGTQRAPRLMGFGPALSLITTGKRIGTDEALALGLIDRIETGDPRDIAFSGAQAALDGSLPTRVTAEIALAPDETAFETATQALGPTPRFAPLRAVEATRAATGPLPQGLRTERALFMECINSPERAALVHAFFAERAVGKAPKADAPEITHIGVVGAGTMGSGIATACLLAGYEVTLIERTQEALDRGVASIGKNLDGAVKRGKLSPEARAKAPLTPSTDLTTLKTCDLIIEAVFEDMEIKKTLLAQLETAAPGAILASNTSYLNINEMAQVLEKPENFLGLHFFSPAHVMRLLEVVIGAKTSQATTAAAFATAKRLKKVAVQAGVGEGFIGNRIMSAYRKAADYMLLDGADVEQIDRAVRRFGFAMGPFEMADMAGLDIAFATRKRLAPTQHPADRYHGAVGDALCEAGCLGRKTGRGYYDHSGVRQMVNPDLAGILQNSRQAAGVTPRTFTDAEIIERYTTAMIAEGLRVLGDGIAARPVDIDAVFLFGYGFPRWRGGPMFYADTLGLDTLAARLDKLHMEDPRFWSTPALLHQLRDAGQTLSDLNEGTA